MDFDSIPNNMNSENYDTDSVQKLEMFGFSTEDQQNCLDVKMQVVEHNTYPKHKLVTTSVNIAGRHMKNMHVVHDLKRGGKFPVSSRYYVVPHEDIIEGAYLAADEIGVKLDLVKDARTSQGYYHLKDEDGMTVSADGKFMFTSFTVRNHNSISVNGDDKIDSGITLVNSVNGSTPILIVPMSYRLFCQNQMIHTLKEIRATGEKSIKYKKILELAQLSWNKHPALQHRFNDFNVFLEEANKTRFIHTKKYSQESLIANMAMKLEMIQDYLEVYPKLAKTNLTPQFVEKVIGVSTPYTVAMPISLTKSLDEKRCGFVAKRKKDEWDLQMVDTKMTQFDLLNAYTDKLTHDPNTRSTINSNLGANRKLNHLFGFGEQMEIIPTAN